MAPNYSANLQKFIDNYNSFEGQLNSYTTQLDEFYDQVNTLLDHASKSGTTMKEVESGRNYLKTKNGLLIAMEDTYADTDFSVNKLNISGSNNYFYVDPKRMTSSNVQFGIGNYKDGEIIQGGLGDLSYNDDHLNQDVSSVKLIPNEYPKIDAINDNNCDISDVYLCSSYAKMNDKPHFGLARVDKDGTSKCSCYIFDDVNRFPDNEIVISSATISDSSLNGISYLGIMFDNTFCSLKDTNYSSNFSGIYNEDSDKINVIDSTSIISGCNKFTGSGMYNVTIGSLNSNNQCAIKQSQT